MPKYLFAYYGGATPENTTEEERQEIMGKWMTWMGGLGDAFADAGNPFGPSKSTTDSSEGGGLTGYSLFTADDLDAAVAAAKDCPIHENGGSVTVYETIEM